MAKYNIVAGYDNTFNYFAHRKINKIINNDNLIDEYFDDAVVVIIWTETPAEDFDFALILDQLS